MFFIKKERGFIMSSIDSAIDLNAGSVSENVKTTLRGELVLAFAVIINSLGVVLMLYSGTGISAIGFRIVYFIISYCLISLGIALSNRCKLPIIPTDLFPRELADITDVAYSRIKISFDVICLAVTACLTGLILGHIKGLGIGTVVAAFTMGKAIGLVGRWLDKKFDFVSFMKK